MQRQRILFSAYRADQYADPDGFMASLGMVLEQYPNEVIMFITDPRTGVQRGKKWPPTISEIVEACDEHIAGIKRREKFANWGKNDPLAIEGPKAEKPTLEALKAKYGENWGLSPNGPAKPLDTFKAPSIQGIASMYQADPSRIERLMNSDIMRKRPDDTAEVA